MCYASPRNVTAKRSENDGVAKCCSNVRVVSDVRRGEEHIKKSFTLCTTSKSQNYLWKIKSFFKDGWSMVKGHPTFIVFSYLLTRTVNELLEYKRLKSNFPFGKGYGVWKLQKMSHATCERSKSSLKMPKKHHFGEFLTTKACSQTVLPDKSI